MRSIVFLLCLGVFLPASAQSLPKFAGACGNDGSNNHQMWQRIASDPIAGVIYTDSLYPAAVSDKVQVLQDRYIFRLKRAGEQPREATFYRKTGSLNIDSLPYEVVGFGPTRYHKCTKLDDSEHSVVLNELKRKYKAEEDKLKAKRDEHERRPNKF
jgi:hypothetical protein